MAEEKSDRDRWIDWLVEQGALVKTEKAVNVMLPPRIDLDDPATGTALDDLEAFYQKSAHDPFQGLRI